MKINKINVITGIALFCFGLWTLWIQYINQAATPIWILTTYWKGFVIWIISILLFEIIGTIKQYQREHIIKK
jgi:hypothetical protein